MWGKQPRPRSLELYIQLGHEACLPEQIRPFEGQARWMRLNWSSVSTITLLSEHPINSAYVERSAVLPVDAPNPPGRYLPIH